MPGPRGIYRSEAGRLVIEASYRRHLAELSVPWRSRFVATSHGRAHVIEAGRGDGEALLLLHGSAANSAAWLGDLPAWGREFRVVAADIPGHPGLSEGTPLALSSGATATWLSDLLDRIGVQGVRIVGMSLGGWAALDFACRHPGRVHALSLLSPGGLAPARRSFLLRALPLLLLGDWGADRVQRLVFGDLAVPDPVLQFARLVSRHYRPVTERVPVIGDAELARLRMPIQFFGGTRDALLRAEDSARRLARLLPQAEIHLLAGAGHAILGQTEAVLSFLLASRDGDSLKPGEG